jgi:hypothetical protein
MAMASERRSFPRYPVQCPVSVTLPEDETNTVYKANANSLSRTSIQIECDATLIAALLRQTKLPYMSHLEFVLPGQKKHTFNIDASVVTHRRLSQQDYVLVLLFRHFDQNQEALLERLLAAQQKPIGLE